MQRHAVDEAAIVADFEVVAAVERTDAPANDFLIAAVAGSGIGGCGRSCGGRGRCLLCKGTERERGGRQDQRGRE
jgi:hypothetical protein